MQYPNILQKKAAWRLAQMTLPSQAPACSARFWRMTRMFFFVALLCLGSIHTASAAPSYQVKAKADIPFELAIGEEAEVATGDSSLLIFFAHVLSDNRCPSNVTCVQAGKAEFQLFVMPKDRTDPAKVTLASTPDANQVQVEIEGQGYKLELVDVLTPAPKQGENFILINYHLMLRITAVETPNQSTSDSAKPDSDATSSDQPNTASFKPRLVDGCVNFTPFDAAAILQEPTNEDEPIGNIIFGPISSEFVGDEGGLQGFCGYASREPAKAKQPSQTHIATQIDADHAVVAQHLTAEVTSNANGTVKSDWFDLFALAEAMGAANPDHDSQAVFDTLYNFAGHFPLLEILTDDASQAPSFKVTEIEVTKAENYDEMFWFWQTLDDGYFSLLISRKGLDFDLVAARLGPQVQEKTVLGYSRVILNKLLDPQPIGNPTDISDSSTSGCDLLTLDEVEAILQAAVDRQAVANKEGAGCKYTFVDDHQQIDPADFTNGFESHGLLVGVIQPQAAKEMLLGMVQELSDTGNVQDGEALQSLIDRLNDEHWADALTQFAALDWKSPSWQVEALREVSKDTLLVTGKSGNGWPQFFLLRPRLAGGIYYMTGVLPFEVEEVRKAISTAANNMADPASVNGLPHVEPSALPPTSTKSVTSTTDCTIIDVKAIEKILGEPVDEHPVAGERGKGCKYTPKAEKVTIDPTDFSPNFDQQGVTVGIMPSEDALWMLADLPKELEESGIATDALRKLEAALEKENVQEAVQILATLDGQGKAWKVAALREVSDHAVTLYTSPETVPQVAIFIKAQADDSLFVVAVQFESATKLAEIRKTVVKLMKE